MKSGIESDEIANTDETGSDSSCGFWKRQFLQTPTKKQRVFDWAYGVVIPVVCVAADPIVFSAHGILAEYKPFAYLLSAVSILAMTAWLLWGERLRWLAAPLAGLFILGSAVSILVGLILIPFSLIGLIVLVGFLGFTPLFSGLVYLRNGVRALRTSGMFLEKRVIWQGAVLTAVVAFVIPYIVNIRLSAIVDRVVHGDVETIERESTKLMYVWPLVDATPIGRQYYSGMESGERYSARTQALADSFEALSGEKIRF